MKAVASAAEDRLVAAYCEGLGLVAIAFDNDQIAVIGKTGVVDPAAGVTTLCWCRNADDAARVASAADASLRRRAAMGDKDAALEAATRAAKRLNLVLYSDEGIAAEAAIVIGRVTREFEQMRASGNLRALNKSYRGHRLDASARGERVVPYAQWMRVYQENLVRKAATALKYL